MGFSHDYKHNIRQCLVAIVAFIDCIIGGAALSCAATLLPQLQKEDSTIKMTEDEGTWFVSFLSLFCIPGTIMGIFILEWIGRKWSYVLVAFNNAILWFVIAISTKTWHLYTARILQGVNLGISYPTCICFVTEITTCKYRSTFVNLLNIGVAFGMLLIDVLGSYCSRQTPPIVMVVLSVIYLLILLKLKNTPVWHLNRKDIEKAKSVYYWYNSVNSENNDDYNQQVDQVELQNSTSKKEFWMACKQKDFLIPLGVVFWFYTTFALSGGYAISSYTVTVMKNVVAYDEYRTTILIDVIRLLATIFTAGLIKYLKIRLIIIACFVLCVVSLLCLCGGLYFENCWIGMRWFILGAILFYTVVYNIGIVNMSNICMGELFTGVTKSVGVSLTVIYLFGLNFLVSLLIPRMFNDFGNIGTFLCFAGCIAVGGIGIFFVMPETRNVSNIQIRQYFQNMFSKSNKYESKQDGANSIQLLKQ